MSSDKLLKKLCTISELYRIVKKKMFKTVIRRATL